MTNQTQFHGQVTSNIHNNTEESAVTEVVREENLSVLRSRIQRSPVAFVSGVIAYARTHGNLVAGRAFDPDAAQLALTSFAEEQAKLRQMRRELRRVERLSLQKRANLADVVCGAVATLEAQAVVTRSNEDRDDARELRKLASPSKKAKAGKGLPLPDAEGGKKLALAKAEAWDSLVWHWPNQGFLFFLRPGETGGWRAWGCRRPPSRPR